ncbi:MAG TPA: glycoside hydrolase family 27 protein [Terriglobia bacterium]|nr:glycoside hydrolase family 27 protein [Terriglobia bacterium]
MRVRGNWGTNIPAFVGCMVFLLATGRVALTASRGARHSTAAAKSGSARAKSDRLATTPPMGWNSWDSYGLSINEQEFKANAEWMAKHLKQFGWQYAVVDEGWFLQNPESGGKPAWQYNLDGASRYMPATNRFPSAAGGAGFKPLADYVHSLGLKFGLHIIRGISREAVAKNLPIANSPFHAADAGDPSDTCPWNSDNFGVKDNAAGQAYYDSVARLYAGWGLDFIKVDCISSRPYKESEIRQISAALKKAGRPIVLSLSPGPTSLANAENVRKYAQMWRISDDFWDYWDHAKSHDDNWTQTLYGQMATATGWVPYAGPGHWPDADMLPIGFIGPRPGLGRARQTRLTHDEQRTLLTFWSIIRSPLIFGGNLTQNDEWTTALLTNAEVIAVNQHSTANRPLIVTNGTVIWSARPDDGRGIYLAIFNRGETPQSIHLPWNEVGLAAGKMYEVRDLWEHKDLGSESSFKLTLQAHACALYRLTSGK